MLRLTSCFVALVMLHRHCLMMSITLNLLCVTRKHSHRQVLLALSSFCCFTCRWRLIIIKFGRPADIKDLNTGANLGPFSQGVQVWRGLIFCHFPYTCVVIFITISHYHARVQVCDRSLPSYTISMVNRQPQLMENAYFQSARLIILPKYSFALMITSVTSATNVNFF